MDTAGGLAASPPPLSVVWRPVGQSIARERTITTGKMITNMPAKKIKARALVGWNTGQRVHKQSKGAGAYARERKKIRHDLKKEVEILNRNR